MRALVVMPATIEALELCDSLSAQGFEVSHAPSGLYALTLFERERPELVVSGDDIADMTGRELLEILNEDNGSGIAFILMTAQAATDLPANAIVVPPDAQISELLARAGITEVNAFDDTIDPSSTLEIDDPGADGLEYALEAAAPPSAQPAPPAAQPAPAAASSAGLTSGEFKFENQGFIHLVRWLSGVTEYSRVEINCGSSLGKLYFVRGTLTHAEFGRQLGDDAIRSLFLAASDHKGGAFSLEAMDAAIAASLPNSISKPITQIVLTWSA